MFRQLSHLAVLSAFLAAFGCEQPASFRLETPDPRLVVVSNFTRDKAVQVFVSRSQFILDEQKKEPVLDAVVEIYEDGEHLETLELVDASTDSNAVPYYTTRSLVPKVNTTYTIEVEASCCAPAMAKSRIPNPIGFSSAGIYDFSLEENPETDELLASYWVSLSFEDPSEEKNYYHISILQQVYEYAFVEGDTVITNSHHRSLVFNPEENENGRVAHIDGGLLLEDNMLNNGEMIHLDVPLTIRLDKNRELLGKLFLELRAVTEEYYRYFSGLSQQNQSSGSPFKEPVIIYDNIEGGLGVFAGYNASLDSLYVQ